MEAFIDGLQKNNRQTKGKFDEKTGEYVGKLEYDSDIGTYSLNFSQTSALTIGRDGTIMSPQILRAQKVLMAQSGKSEELTSFEMRHDERLTTDVHSHYTAMLEPDKLFALGLKHNVSYHAFYMYALGLELSEKQKDMLIANMMDISKKNKEEDSTQQELSEDSARKILEELEENKENPKKIGEILDTYGLKQKLTLDFTTLVLDAPELESKENIQKILKSCSLSTEEQSTFTDMLDVYSFRFPFTNGNGNLEEQKEDRSEQIRENADIPDSVKEIYEQVLMDSKDEKFSQNDLQQDTMLLIHRQAKEQGLSYIEMSHNALASDKNMDVIRTYNSILPKIEGKEGEPKLRFLAGISRTSNPKKVEETFQYVKDSLQSKYVSGIDFLGEEFNSTNDFENLLGKVTEYALDEDPDMVIRVHAGETNSFEGNIEKVFEVVYGEYFKKIEAYEKEGKDISQIKKPNLRIGHGIYGLEEGRMIPKDSELGKIVTGLETRGLFEKKHGQDEISLLNFASQMDVVVERNFTSNILLSHKSGLKGDIIKTYLENGVKCVLGTDGYGVYGTTIEEEQILAGVLGLDDEYIAKMKEAEEYIQDRSEAREEYISKRQFEEKTYQSEEKKKKSGPVSVLSPISPDKTNIVIAGGSFNGYDRDGNYKNTELTPEEERAAEEMLTKLMDSREPEKCRFIIGGKLQGYEKKLVELNQKRIKEGKNGFQIVVVTNQSKEKISQENAELFQNSGITVLEAKGYELASYKKINEEIFSEEFPAELYVFDGQQAAANLIADANKGKNNKIFVKKDIENLFLMEKAETTKDVSLFSMSFKDAKTFAREEDVQDINTDIVSLMTELADRSKGVEDKDKSDDSVK